MNILDRAAAVVTAINAGTYSDPYDDPGAVVAVRLYNPLHKLEDLDDLKVSVAPARTLLDRTDRGGDVEEDAVLYVGVERRTDGSRAQADALVVLCREIADVLLDMDDCVGVEIAPVYDPQRLEELRVFTSILTVTLRGVE